MMVKNTRAWEAPQRSPHPFLVQRISAVHDQADEEGIDAAFSFDYMGSAEFEYGALPTALRAMRNNWAEYVQAPKRIKLEDGKIAWYVGPDDEERLALVREFFEDQLGDRKIRLKERTCIQETYAETTLFGVQMGWWALDLDRPWLLFTKKDHAKEWIKRCRPKGCPGDHR